MFRPYASGMASKQDRQERHLSKLARERREKVAGILFALVLFIIPTVISMPVVWRFGGWFLSWVIVLYVAFTTFKKAERITSFRKGVICVCATAGILALSWNSGVKMWTQEKAAALSGAISAPRHWFKKSPKPQTILQVGNSGTNFIFAGSPNQDLFGFLYNAGLRIEAGENGLEISTPIRDRQGHLIVEIKKNHWSVSPDRSVCWDKNYNNNSLEVMDARGHVVLQIRIFADRVQLQGEWHDEFGNGNKLMVSPDPSRPGALIPIWRNTEAEQRQASLLIKPIFKYPSSEHWGELIEPVVP